nr:uncharacterized protein LOC115856612 [Globicephala melas]
MLSLRERQERFLRDPLLKPYREWIPGRAVLSLGLRAGRRASPGARIAREPSGVWGPEDHPPPPAVPSLAQPPPGSGWARQPQGPEAGRRSWAFLQGRGEGEGRWRGGRVEPKDALLVPAPLAQLRSPGGLARVPSEFGFPGGGRRPPPRQGPHEAARRSVSLSRAGERPCAFTRPESREVSGRQAAAAAGGLRHVLGEGSQGARGNDSLSPSVPQGSRSTAVGLARESQVTPYAPASKDSFQLTVRFERSPLVSMTRKTGFTRSFRCRGQDPGASQEESPADGAPLGQFHLGSVGLAQPSGCAKSILRKDCKPIFIWFSLKTKQKTTCEFLTIGKILTKILISSELLFLRGSELAGAEQLCSLLSAVCF